MYLSVLGLNLIEKCRLGGMFGTVSPANKVLNLSTVESIKRGVSCVPMVEDELALKGFERVLMVGFSSLGSGWDTNVKV